MLYVSQEEPAPLMYQNTLKQFAHYWSQEWKQYHHHANSLVGPQTAKENNCVTQQWHQPVHRRD